MKPFTDSSGTVWQISVNVGTIKRVRDLAGFDLLKIVESQSALRELSDPILLVNVLYACVKPQADAAGVSDEKFGESLVGDGLEGASDALLTELSDFFPSHRREPLKKALAKIKELNSKCSQIALTRLDDPSLEKRILDAVNQDIPPLNVGNPSGT